MNNKQVTRIIFWSTVALVIPIFGQLFVSGWNWGIGDFIFAWVFFNILGFVYTFVTNKVTHPIGRIVTGIIVVVFFSFIWIQLATG